MIHICTLMNVEINISEKIFNRVNIWTRLNKCNNKLNKKFTLGLLKFLVNWFVGWKDDFYNE